MSDRQGTAPRVAVIGGGWAGLAAAVEATRLGATVTLFEMAPQLGGRARRVDVDGRPLDNGQHILIGAYTQTLQLLDRLGVDSQAAFVRSPLRLCDATGAGLRLPPGTPTAAFVRGVLGNRRWALSTRVALLFAAARWGLQGFRCDARLTVAELTHALPAALRRQLIEPLCVAALNTPAAEASASVFLRVLRDALFAGTGSADLLLPRTDLGSLLPAPAAAWLAANGADLRPGTRVNAIARDAAGWSVDGGHFDAVVLATTCVEAERLVREIAPEWARRAAGIRHEPIVTVYAQSAGTRLPEPMIALDEGPEAPAQFVFDRGALGGHDGVLAFVISGAQAWVDRGAEATVAATLAQARAALGPLLQAPPTALRVLTEKRATFRCTPRLERPPRHIAPGLWAAADYVDGPYPATLEGAVRAGLAAARDAVASQAT